MSTIKNFFSLLLLVAIASVFNSTTASAQAAPVGDPAIVFNAENPDEWNINTIPATVRDGQTVLATNKTSKTQFIAVVREGKIVQIGTKEPNGRLVVLQPTGYGPCSTKHCYAHQISHCYPTPGGGCVCVCGAYKALYPGN